MNLRQREKRLGMRREHYWDDDDEFGDNDKNDIVVNVVLFDPSSKVATVEHTQKGIIE